MNCADTLKIVVSTYDDTRDPGYELEVKVTAMPDHRCHETGNGAGCRRNHEQQQK